MPAEVDRELGLVFLLAGRQTGQTAASVQQAGVLQGHQPGGGQRQGLIQDRLDTRAGIDRDREQRQVLRQRQRAVGAQMPP